MLLTCFFAGEISPAIIMNRSELFLTIVLLFPLYLQLFTDLVKFTNNHENFSFSLEWELLCLNRQISDT